MEPSTAHTTAKARKPRYALHKLRFIVRFIALLCLIISLALLVHRGVRCGSRLRKYESDPSHFVHNLPVTQICWTDAYYGEIRPMVFVIFALLWDIVEIVVLCFNKRGIHPIASIIFDILITLGLFSQAVFGFYRVGEENDEGLYITTYVFVLFACVLHLILFILDIITVHRWRRTHYGRSTYGQPLPYQQPYAPQLNIRPPVPGQYTSLPPPPPGMVYMVPVDGSSAIQTVPANQPGHVQHAHTGHHAVGGTHMA